MDKKIYLILWLVQCLLGTLITVSFIVLAIDGRYDVKQYLSTFVIGIIFLVMGIVGIVKWLKNK